MMPMSSGNTTSSAAALQQPADLPLLARASGGRQQLHRPSTVPLRLEQLGDAPLGEIEQRLELAPGERGVLAGSLHLHESGRIEHHDVRVHLGITVLQIGEIEALLAVDHAHRDRGDELTEGRRHAGLLGQPGARVGQGDAAAGDARRAGAAIGLEHIAVDPDGVLAERHRGHRRPQRAADEPLDLLGPAARAVALARGALERWRGGAWRTRR